MIVAIDGPVGVGKSTVAREVARRLGLLHIDTGAMYRALAWRCLEEDLNPEDPEEMCDLAERTRIRLEPSPAGAKVFCDDLDVSEVIRSPDVTALVSKVSAHPGLRKLVVDQQRAMGASGSVVMEGRDIGTVVFPNAEVKVYLNADLAARTQRRAADYEARGVPWSHDEIQQSIRARDEFDQNRVASPLRIADDATLLDTTSLTYEQVVSQVVEIIRAKLRQRDSRGA